MIYFIYEIGHGKISNTMSNSICDVKLMKMVKLCCRFVLFKLPQLLSELLVKATIANSMHSATTEVRQEQGI